MYRQKAKTEKLLLNLSGHFVYVKNSCCVRWPIIGISTGNVITLCLSEREEDCWVRVCDCDCVCQTFDTDNLIFCLSAKSSGLFSWHIFFFVHVFLEICEAMANRGKSKIEKDRDLLVQDRLQIILTRMLQDEENKYCVDCDSKGKINCYFKAW